MIGARALEDLEPTLPATVLEALDQPILAVDPERDVSHRLHGRDQLTLCPFAIVAALRADLQHWEIAHCSRCAHQFIYPSAVSTSRWDSLSTLQQALKVSGGGSLTISVSI